MIDRIAIPVFFICWLILIVLQLLELLRFFQLEEYLPARYLAWSVQNWSKVLRPAEILSLLLTGVTILIKNYYVPVIYIGIITILFDWYYLLRSQKVIVKPLVYTNRLKRLLFVCLVVVATEIFLIYQLLPVSNNLIEDEFSSIIMALMFLLLAQFTFFNVLIGNFLIFPVEEALRKYYIYTARKIIREINPRVIGITGSYGKTTTKELVAHILSQKYNVLRVPKSYNTLMGICKVIRSDLNEAHEFFVVEMGAYRTGEIKNICKLVNPTYGVLTAIGPMHLERFKTIENVAKAKSELISALPVEGTAVLNGDDLRCRQIAQQAMCNVSLYGQVVDDQYTCYATDISYSEEGTDFILMIPRTRGQFKVKTQLLGEHNISNLMAAIMVSIECGFTIKEAILAAQTAKPFEHRLQLLKLSNGIIYIDDSYNSNPIGAKMALEVLSRFTGRKILVTPGFVELGAMQESEHEKLGILAGTRCDYIFIIGKSDRASQILKGIGQTPIISERVFCYNTLAEARNKLTSLLQPGDVVLFENDLPDNYF